MRDQLNGRHGKKNQDTAGGFIKELKQWAQRLPEDSTSSVKLDGGAASDLASSSDVRGHRRILCETGDAIAVVAAAAAAAAARLDINASCLVLICPDATPIITGHGSSGILKRWLNRLACKQTPTLLKGGRLIDPAPTQR